MKSSIPPFLVFTSLAACHASEERSVAALPVTSASPTSTAATPVVADPYRSDLDAICNAEARSGASSVAAADRPATMAKWIDAHLQTQRARDLMGALATIAPADRPAKLRAEAASNGVATCPFADGIERR